MPLTNVTTAITAATPITTPSKVSAERSLFAHRSEDVRAQMEDFFGHVAIDAVDERDHGNHRGNSDHHAEQGKRGAQFVRPQRQERDLDRLGNVHSSTTRASRRSSWGAGGGLLQMSLAGQAG